MFARHHSAKHLHKCAQLLRFSISLKFKTCTECLSQWGCTSYTWTCLKCFKTSARNSVQHKKKSRPWSLPSLGTTQQNICSNVHNYYASGWAGTSQAVEFLSVRLCPIYFAFDFSFNSVRKELRVLCDITLSLWSEVASTSGRFNLKEIFTQNKIQ